MKVRLLCRSHDSFVKAGYSENDFDIIISDLTKPMHDASYFGDVSSVICVARPRSLKGGDDISYFPMVENLCSAVIENRVPRLLLHGMPYLENNQFGESQTMKIIKDTEQSARNRFEIESSSAPSSLTISRICEMSEIGHLMEESLHMLGFFPCACGYNPVLHPCTSRDFATAIANYAEDSTFTKNELLVGGPYQLTWKELADMYSRETGLKCITLPLVLYKAALLFIGVLCTIFPSLKGLHLSMRLLMIPMTTNTANDKFISVGNDRMEDFLRDYSNDETGWVHQKIYHTSPKKTK